MTMSESLLDRVIRRQGWMDGVAEGIQKAVGGIYGVLGPPGRAIKDVMHGTRLLGHPLHPALTDLPMGSWTAGVVADYVAHLTPRLPTEAGDIALAVGLGGAVLSAVTGYTDFHETFGQERRVALAHGGLMTIAVAVEALSLGLRWWAGPDAHAAAVGLSTAGLALAVGASWLGGQLVFGMGTMVNRNAFLEGPEEFVAVGAPEDFPEGQMRAADAAGLRVLVVRRNGRLSAISDVCSHAGGPLHEGSLDGDTVICPWHASCFRVTDGRVEHGPATFDQPALVVRETDGRVEVRLEAPLH
jgi:nitrite reductase/ring-hydroxylating ferredoxin subunit/uncharacterized membrane protein